MKALLKMRLLLGRWLLVLMLAIVPLMTPKSAMAAGIPTMDMLGNALAAAGNAIQIAFNAMMEFQMVSLNSTLENLGFLSGEAATAQLKQDQLIANDAATKAYQIAQLTIAAEIAADSPETRRADQVLCRNTRMAKTQISAQAGSGGNVDRLLAGWENNDRGFPKGTGPAKIREVMAYRCGAGNGNVTGYMSKEDLAVNGEVDPENPCLAKKDKFINADISVRTIKTGPYKEPLEMPAVDGNGYFKLIPGDDNQVLYSAGVDFCYHTAGANPRPPRGKALEGPEGQTNMARYAGCKAKKSELVSHCFVELDYASRPDCSEEINADKCAQQHQICKDAIAEGLDLSADSFGNCQDDSGEGLSPYQMDWIKYHICLQEELLYVSKESDAKSMELFAAQQRCSQILIAWESQVAARRKAFLESISGLQMINSCFAEMQR